MSVPPASYQIVCLHPVSGQVLRIFDSQSIYELRYSRVYNSIGACVFTIPFTQISLDIVDLTDMFVDVQRTSPLTGELITEETYLARRWQRFSESDERYSIGGVSLNHLLSRRVIDPDDDPNEAGGYSTKAGAADTVMYQYASEQIGGVASAERQMPGLSIAGVFGTAAVNVGYRLAYENLLETLQKIAQQASLDFQIVRTTGINMQLNIGNLTVDRTQDANYPNTPFVLLNPQRGNLSSPSFTRDRGNEATFVYMRGKGQGAARTLLTTFSDATSASPFNRIEVAADARNVEKGDSLGMLTEADNVLKERQQLIQLDFTPEGTEPGNLYRLNWDVGDLLSASWDENRADLRVQSIEINISESGENLKATMQVLND